MVKKIVFKMIEGDDKMKKQGRTSKTEQNMKDFSEVSNVCGRITDEEFSTEFINRDIKSAKDDALFQFNFDGAELEKVNNAKNIDSKLK